MHKDWCGKPCSECENPCALDMSMPCSPDCECLGENGEHNCDECKHCDAICEELNLSDFYDFCLCYAENEGDFDTVLDYNDFQVFLHIDTGRYFYFDNTDDGDDFYELELCAVLNYSHNHNLLIRSNEAGKIMSELFECDCCGESVCDDRIQYLWFKKK